MLIEHWTLTFSAKHTSCVACSADATICFPASVQVFDLSTFKWDHESPPTNQHQLFTGQMPFLSPNQQCHSSEGIFTGIIKDEMYFKKNQN